MVTIEDVKKETFERLTALGYDPETVLKLVNSFWKIIKYYDGKPEAVLTDEGQEIYL